MLAQQQQTVRIGQTTMLPPGKKGIVRPCSEGYYRLPVGAYNAYNSGGFLYDGQSGLAMFQPGSVLMRHAEKGVLRGEFKHPVMLPGMTREQYMQRIRTIDLDRASHHIRWYEIEQSRDSRGRSISLVYAILKPWGPYGEMLEQSIKNPHENTYFSVRSITFDDPLNRVKYTREIVTHDFVGEGGILEANKYNTGMGLEDFEGGGVEITPLMLHELHLKQQRAKNLGLECHEPSAAELMERLGWGLEKPAAKRPAYTRW